MKILLTLVPIASLLLLGMLITLRSGVEGVRGWTRTWQVITSNISGMLLRLAGLATGLVFIHKLIGYPIAVTW